MATPAATPRPDTVTPAPQPDDTATADANPKSPSSPQPNTGTLLLLQRQLALIESAEADLRREHRHGPPATAISRMLGDSAVFLEHWQSLAGSSSTATVADVCQWLQRSLPDIVSPGSIARGIDRARQAASGEQSLAEVGGDAQQTAEERDASDALQRATVDQSKSLAEVSRLLLSMIIVTTLHCRRGELIYEYITAAAAAEAAATLGPASPAATAHPAATLCYRDFQLHLPVTELGFTVESTLMVILVPLPPLLLLLLLLLPPLLPLLLLPLLLLPPLLLLLIATIYPALQLQISHSQSPGIQLYARHRQPQRRRGAHPRP